VLFAPAAFTFVAMKYIPAKTPRILKWAYPNCIWQIPNKENAVYLTFDDGPTPEVTPWVLKQLEQYNAKATFFLIGNNVALYPEIVEQIKTAGHSIGNHSYNHENGWETDDQTYFNSMARTDELLGVDLLRPPYGRIKKSQIKVLKEKYKIIMWDVLSADWMPENAPQKCITNVLENVKSGSIIVFHDSQKAWPNLKVALPEVLRRLSQRGFSFKAV
jgi:peptidoglycan/xylan/chitin deacetylase (PgdA/CDA1 family)